MAVISHILDLVIMIRGFIKNLGYSEYSKFFKFTSSVSVIYSDTDSSRVLTILSLFAITNSKQVIN